MKKGYKTNWPIHWQDTYGFQHLLVVVLPFRWPAVLAVNPHSSRLTGSTYSIFFLFGCKEARMW